MFIGPFEHHSNELPWRESIADVVQIREDSDGHIDLEHLDAELSRYAERPLKIGSFSAASNVTGIVSNTCAVADILHRHGALSFWDFAAAAPYIEIEMYPCCPTHPAARAKTPCSSRRTSSSAGRALPEFWSYARNCCATACRTCLAAARWRT
ncbi:aminotransferase class V-fold PLP-dependent enzyme [Fodinicola feengrottensis]|uniref:aminotransferase class V-fold PLP-dependent enzyme n=1 Tax=Fodinicola feengrottensis TaxID=435914 RepID=UPI0024435AD2|nr:aminotransferase class V-fold PLP-dependent enzyme [Fodinicola feengrottensis]